MMARPNRHLWKISAISEVNNFLSRKEYILRKRSVVKDKGRKPVTVNWEFKSKEEPGGLISLKCRNVVKGYMQVPRVDSQK